MADNVLELAGCQLGSPGLNALGSALGLPSGGEAAAVDSGIASVLAGMLNKSESKTGLTSLFKAIADSDELDFAAIGITFGDAAGMSSLQQTGGKILECLFGSKAADVGGLLAGSLGVGKNTGLGLLQVAAPVAMSLFSTRVRDGGLDMGGFATLLFSQKTFIQDKLPDGLLKTIGVHEFADLGQHLEPHGHREPLTVRPRKPADKGRAYGKWVWPLLIVLAVLYSLNMCARRDAGRENNGAIVLEEEQLVVQAAPDFARSLRDHIANAERDPNRTFPLDIRFGDRNAIATSASVPDVQALAAVMTEYPGLTIAISGHASGEGSDAANRKLAQERADTVRRMLLRLGIAPDRITAAAMDSAKPAVDKGGVQGGQKSHPITVQVVTVR
ncbi:DUF937 domain-containing protein [Microbulbifer sp. 2201CG32-9]|uniref:DUF937 domain-containing protein n=1 Tax=Microbulbifer sp. 2201CG32-9 TaxID=3232309 RepID=UPI00345B80FF